MGNKTLATYAYGDKNGLLLSQSYGNGASVSFTYDNLGRAKTTTYSSGRVLSYIYTGDGQLYSVHDSATGYTYIYTYDSLGRLIASRVEDSSSQELMRTKLWYNASNQITKQTWTIGDTTYQETYAYNTGDATLSSYQNALGQTVSLGYDFLRRLSTVTAGDIYTQTYTYRDIDSAKTTAQVSGLAYSGFANAPSYGYTYDVLGNILTYTENGTAYAYTYDDLNQLLTATGGGKAWAYTYDLGGNILTATDGTTSHTYTYGDANWADLLTAFDGETITYDNSGNPLSYYNGSRYTFAWAEGRNLVSAAEGTNTYTYAYDSDGLRLSKTVDGATHNYFYASGKLLRETYGNTTLDFLYSNTGSPYALIYTAGETTATYYYITNLQGDVLGLIDASGNSVASYTYDPYGKVLTATGAMAETNPLRYRGYYYDSETELYYLQSRYYDPTTCRFINADAYASTGQGILGHNMFAYCGNNPINFTDYSGNAGIWFYLIRMLKMAYIHTRVQAHIKETNSGVECELWLTKNRKLVGRADVMEGNYVWEIKHATDPSIKESRMAAAQAQAQGYIGLTAVRTNTEIKALGPAGRFKGSFTITIYNGTTAETYLVKYDTPRSGVIIYSVHRTNAAAKVNHALKYEERATEREKSNSGAYILGGVVLVGAVLAGVGMLKQEIFDGGSPMLALSPG